MPVQMGNSIYVHTTHRAGKLSQALRRDWVKGKNQKGPNSDAGCMVTQCLTHDKTADVCLPPTILCRTKDLLNHILLGHFPLPNWLIVYAFEDGKLFRSKSPIGYGDKTNPLTNLMSKYQKKSSSWCWMHATIPYHPRIGMLHACLPSSIPCRTKYVLNPLARFLSLPWSFVGVCEDASLHCLGEGKQIGCQALNKNSLTAGAGCMLPQPSSPEYYLFWVYGIRSNLLGSTALHWC